MKLKDKLKAAFLATRIEYHWWIILRFRARGNKLLDRGEPLNSKRLLKLSRRIDHHSSIAKRQEGYYGVHWVLPPQGLHPKQAETTTVTK